MSDKIDREIREVNTRKVTPLPNNSVNGSRISEQRTTQIRDDDTSNGVILGVVIVLAIGAGAIAYFLNTRLVPTPIVLPRATDTLKENKTVIDRSTTKEVSPAPATPQIAPKIEVTLPPVTITQPPDIIISPAPTTTIMIQPEPVAPVTPPQATTQPQSASPSPTPSAVK